MKKMLWILLLTPGMLFAQPNEAIMKPIHAVFAAMKVGDTTSLRRAFHPSAVLYTVGTNKTSGEPALRKESVQDFVNAVGKPHTGVYNEVISNEKVLVDGDFAQVWADYNFYIDGTFHHCGVDAFQLMRNAKGDWFIFVLSDTRRTVGCK